MTRLLDSLEAIAGEGTSMVTFLLPPKVQICRAAAKLTEEYGTSSNIKKTANRQSVQAGALLSAQAKLKLYKQTPANGLAIFVGLGGGLNSRMVSIAFEPLKPLTRYLYLCDRRFHVDELRAALADEATFGFIVITGESCLFATLAGTTKTVLQKISVDLPNRHGRGGQSAPRFQRLRLEKRAAYCKKVAELAMAHFLVEGHGRTSIEGLVIAGAAEMKESLLASGYLHAKLSAQLIRTVGVSSGGEAGLAQAVDLVAEAIGGAKLVAERQALHECWGEMERGAERCCFGLNETIAALEQGAVTTLIVHHELDAVRLHVRHAHSTLLPSATAVLPVRLAATALAGSEVLEAALPHELRGAPLTIDRTPLIEWLAEHHREHGASLRLVGSATAEGVRFKDGLGGLGALLHYAVQYLEDASEDAGQVDGVAEDHAALAPTQKCEVTQVADATDDNGDATDEKATTQAQAKPPQSNSAHEEAKMETVGQGLRWRRQMEASARRRSL